MGGLVRCDGCGGVLWSPLHSDGAPPICNVCGEPLKPERRRPGPKFGARRISQERRDLAGPVDGVSPDAPEIARM